MEIPLNDEEIHEHPLRPDPHSSEEGFLTEFEIIFLDDQMLLKSITEAMFLSFNIYTEFAS